MGQHTALGTGAADLSSYGLVALGSACCKIRREVVVFLTSEWSEIKMLLEDLN